MSITLQQYTDQLKAKLAECKPGDLQAITRVLSNHTAFGVEHFEELDKEAQQLVDNVLATTKAQMAKVIPTLPASPQKRVLARGLAKVTGEHYSVESFVSMLESVPDGPSDYVKDGTRIVEGIVQRAADVLFDITESGSSQSPYIMGMLIGHIEDAIVALHLARKKMVNQTVSVIRNIHESLERVELFLKDHDALALWLKEEDPDRFPKGLGPTAVSKKLGNEDPWYSFYSRIVHGRTANLQSRAGMRRDSESGEAKTMVVWVGGTRNEWVLRTTMGLVMHESMRLLLRIVDAGNGVLEQSEAEEHLKYAWDLQMPYIKTHMIEWSGQSGDKIDELKELIKQDPFEPMRVTADQTKPPASSVGSPPTPTSSAPAPKPSAPSTTPPLP